MRNSGDPGTGVGHSSYLLHLSDVRRFMGAASSCVQKLLTADGPRCAVSELCPRRAGRSPGWWHRAIPSTSWEAYRTDTRERSVAGSGAAYVEGRPRAPARSVWRQVDGMALGRRRGGGAPGQPPAMNARSRRPTVACRRRDSESVQRARGDGERRASLEGVDVVSAD